MLNNLFTFDPVMVPIYAGSAVCVGLVIDHFCVIRWKRVMPDEQTHQLERLQFGQGWDADMRYSAAAKKSLASELLLLAERFASRSPQETLAALDRLTESTAAAFYRRIGWLETIAKMAVLFGLIGALLAMINGFGAANANKAAMMQTIAGALKPTLFATVLAIVAGIAHSYFALRIESFTESLKKETLPQLAEKVALLPPNANQPERPTPLAPQGRPLFATEPT